MEEETGLQKLVTGRGEARIDLEEAAIEGVEAVTEQLKVKEVTVEGVRLTEEEPRREAGLEEKLQWEQEAVAQVFLREEVFDLVREGVRRG